MTKQELKTGMLLIFNTDERSLVLLGTERGDLFVGNGIYSSAEKNSWGELERFNDNLIYEYIEYLGLTATEFRVDKVFSLPNANVDGASFTIANRNLLWERETA